MDRKTDTMTTHVTSPARAFPADSPESGQPVAVWDLKAALGEGPVWDTAGQAFYCVDILGRFIHRYEPQTGATRSWSTPLRPCFLVPVAGGGLLCGLEDGLYRFDPTTGGFQVLLAVETDRPGNRLNDGHVDPAGRLWFGTMNEAENSPDGALYSLEAAPDTPAGLRARCRHSGYTVANGPAVSPDGHTLYHCDSPLGVIYAFTLTDAGELGDQRVFARLENGFPDGLAMDRDGTLWAGVWGGGRIERFHPDGTRLEPVAVPARNVTKVAFGGADGRTLLITTARQGVPEDVLTREPGNGTVFALRASTPGLPSVPLMLP